MPIVTEVAKRALQFLLSESNFHRTRDNIVVASGAGKLAAGTVLGKVAATGKYVPSPATGAGGSQVGSAILGYPVDATSADAAVMAVTRDCEVKAGELVYEATVNDATKKATKNAELQAVGIIVR